MTAPDLQQASAFLAALDPSAITWTFQTFDDSESEPKRPELTTVRHGTLEQHAAWLASMNAQGAGVFVTINETDGKGRKSENITRVRAAFADFDKADTATPERLRADTLPPSITLESSPGKWHAYWLADDLKLDDFKPLQKEIIRRWGTDASVSDLSRVMRLPGFFHRKGEPRLVRLAEVTGQRYSATQLAARYPAPARAAPAPREAHPAAQAGGASLYGAAALESACKAMAGAEEGTRNHTLNREAFSIGQLVAGGEVPEALALCSLMEAASDSGLPEHEICRTLEKSFADGMKQPRTATEQPQLDVGAAFRAAGAAIDPAPALSGLVPVSLEDVMTATLEPVGFAVKPWMPLRLVTLLGGHGGVGKSSLALAIGAHVACGRSFAGHEVARRSVTFVSLEDEPSIVRLRLRRIIEVYGLPAVEVLERLRLLDGTQTFAALMTGAERPGARPSLTATYRQLAEQVQGAGLILIDNASDAFDANENSRSDVRAFMGALVDIARANNAAVVLLAHIDKAAAKFGGQNNSYSGSTAWHNSARSRLALLLEQDGRCRLVHEKANHSRLAEPMGITWVQGVPLPQDATGSEGTEAEDQQAILDAIHAAIGAGGNVPDNLTPGAYSIFNTLKLFPEYSQRFGDSTGKARAHAAVVALKNSGRVRTEEYASAHRKTQKRLVPA